MLPDKLHHVVVELSPRHGVSVPCAAVIHLQIWITPKNNRVDVSAQDEKSTRFVYRKHFITFVSFTKVNLEALERPV